MRSRCLNFSIVADGQIPAESAKSGVETGAVPLKGGLVTLVTTRSCRVLGAEVTTPDHASRALDGAGMDGW